MAPRTRREHYTWHLYRPHSSAEWSTFGDKVEQDFHSMNAPVRFLQGAVWCYQTGINQQTLRRFPAPFRISVTILLHKQLQGRHGVLLTTGWMHSLTPCITISIHCFMVISHSHLPFFHRVFPTQRSINTIHHSQRLHTDTWYSDEGVRSWTESNQVKTLLWVAVWRLLDD